MFLNEELKYPWHDERQGYSKYDCYDENAQMGNNHILY